MNNVRSLAGVEKHSRTRVEIALDDVDGALAAEESGADRIELCGGIADGGTTASVGVARSVAALLGTTSLMLLIRPRAGDFVYSPLEVDVMVADIESLRAAVPQAGFAIGALEIDGGIALPALRRMLAAASGASVTFHKAFDSTPHLFRALDTLIELGVDRVLTSGGRPTATEGIPEIRELVSRSAGRIGIIAAGSIRADNARAIVAGTGVPDIHLKARGPRRSLSLRPGAEYATPLTRTDPALVRTVVTTVHG